MAAVETPVTALFEHFSAFAKSLEQDLAVLNDTSTQPHVLHHGTAVPILQHIQSTTTAAASQIQGMLTSCQPSMQDILQLCRKMYEENEVHISKVEDALEQYGYQKDPQRPMELPAVTTEGLSSSNGTRSATIAALGCVGTAPAVALTADIVNMYPEGGDSPKTPTLEACGGISETALAFLSARRPLATPKLNPRPGVDHTVAGAEVNRQLFDVEAPGPAHVAATDLSLAMEVDDTGLSASMLNRSTIHPLLAEVSAEEFERELPLWLQDLLNKDVQSVNMHVKAINEYISEKWFQMDEEPRGEADNTYSLTKEELERLIGLPEKMSKGLLLCLKALRRIVSRQQGAETRYFLK